MNAWWRALPPRDRRALSVLAAFVAVVVGWSWIWQPLASERARLRTEIGRMKADLPYLEAAAQEVTRLRASGALDPLDRQGRSLLALADAGARDAGLGGVLKRVEPVSQGRANLWFENVPFDALVDWLEQLQARYGIRVDELAVDRAAGVGSVNARVGLADVMEAK